MTPGSGRGLPAWTLCLGRGRSPLERGPANRTGGESSSRPSPPGAGSPLGTAGLWWWYGMAVVPVQPPVLGLHDEPLFPKNLQKSYHGLLDIFGVDRFTHGDVIRLDHAFCVKEDKTICLDLVAFTGPG
jgi:hypothetical protein